jgi:hypothetical protein
MHSSSIFSARCFGVLTRNEFVAVFANGKCQETLRRVMWAIPNVFTRDFTSLCIEHIPPRNNNKIRVFIYFVSYLLYLLRSPQEGKENVSFTSSSYLHYLLTREFGIRI